MLVSACSTDLTKSFDLPAVLRCAYQADLGNNPHCDGQSRKRVDQLLFHAFLAALLFSVSMNLKQS